MENSLETLESAEENSKLTEEEKDYIINAFIQNIASVRVVDPNLNYMDDDRYGNFVRYHSMPLEFELSPVSTMVLLDSPMVRKLIEKIIEFHGEQIIERR